MAKRQTKEKETTEWKYSTKAKFGWCLTGQHKSCRKTSPTGTCGCDCHKND